ncbi:hypothetical protein CRG98_044890 [Punica granatum]|uniref:Uncharacterized protein n=1 Tax=Punica granatum TaxID=22663 RepID=A0A2I0HSN5_PUNGR|nr:hypothetical protein CRG98_044890 [Punica granatum]
MEKDSLRGSNNGTPSRAGAGDGLLRSATSDAARQAQSSDFVLQWGNRKRLRCMKVQVKDDSAAPAHRTTARVDRRVVRADRDPSQPGTATNTNHGNGYLNLRHRPCSPPMPPPQRVLRKSRVVLLGYLLSVRSIPSFNVHRSIPGFPLSVSLLIHPNGVVAAIGSGAVLPGHQMPMPTGNMDGGQVSCLRVPGGQTPISPGLVPGRVGSGIWSTLSRQPTHG